LARVLSSSRPGFLLLFFNEKRKKGENDNVSSRKRPTETKQEILSIQRQLSNRFKNRRNGKRLAQLLLTVFATFSFCCCLLCRPVNQIQEEEEV
jgi:hypothetical protein